jgi:plasmid maintenance system antidote protein VapI
MNSTMTLLDRATTTTGQSLTELSRALSLNPNALHAAKGRQHLSPAIAGAIAEQLGENIEQWIAIAALESEKDSACKDRMLKRMGLWRKR